jgi:arylsulfatase A-like enzyme
VVDATTQLIDILPTVFELAKLAPSSWPAGIDGHSLVQLLAPTDLTR